MEDKCINNQYSTDLSLLYQNRDFKPFHTIIICNNCCNKQNILGQLGDGRQPAYKTEEEDHHRLISFLYEKSRKGWIPRNIYTNYPHIKEAALEAQRKLIEQYQNAQNNPGDGHGGDCKESRSLDENDTRELFKRDPRDTIGSLNFGSGIDFSVRDMVEASDYLCNNMSIGEALSMSRKDSLISSGLFHRTIRESDEINEDEGEESLYSLEEESSIVIE